MLNTVPIYDCFAEMENGKFVYSMLDEEIDKHIDIGSDMIVFHPTLTRELAHEVFQSSRIILSSRKFVVLHYSALWGIVGGHCTLKAL